MKLNKAIFLDRDGTVIANVINPVNGEFESPYQSKDVTLLPGVLETLLKMQQSGYLLFLISNQPSYAKGTCTLTALEEIHQRFLELTVPYGIKWSECYYCYHHPNSIVPELKGPCECRKPGAYFLKKAGSEHNLDLKNSWIIGDRDTDVECGQAMGLKTILLPDLRKVSATDKNSSAIISPVKPDFYCANLSEAFSHIKVDALMYTP